MSDRNGTGHRVTVTRDIVYGHARIGFNEGKGPMTSRSLCLDLYAPDDAAPGSAGPDRQGAAAPRPALILAFGGAFHRGAKDNDVRPEDGPKNTSIATYCERFAARGIVCFSIDYRLTPEDPDPGDTPALGTGPVPSGRIDVVRGLLGLPPATPDQLKRGQEAAIDDMTTAFRFVAGDARRFGVDPARIAVGGYSAGGRMAVTAALAEAISPAAVVSLSGVASVATLAQFHASARRRMPLFLAYGEHDLDYVIPAAEALLEALARSAHPHRGYRLPGQTHFYPASAALEPGAGPHAGVEAAMAAFLSECL